MTFTTEELLALIDAMHNDTLDAELRTKDYAVKDILYSKRMHWQAIRAIVAAHPGLVRVASDGAHIIRNVLDDEIDEQDMQDYLEEVAAALAAAKGENK